MKWGITIIVRHATLISEEQNSAKYEVPQNTRMHALIYAYKEMHALQCYGREIPIIFKEGAMKTVSFHYEGIYESS